MSRQELEKDLAELKIERRTLKGALTRLQNRVGALTQESDSLLTELELVSEINKKYEAVQSKIEKIQWSQADIDEAAVEAAQNEERDKFETQYVTIVAGIKTKLNAASATIMHQTPNTNNVVTNRVTENVNLKPLPLPTFSGKYSEWLTFYESFKSLVHDESNMPDISKFHYLKSCLKDEAQRAIASLTVSGKNYAIAMETLKKRFENKRLIVQDHITNILKWPNISKPNSLELRNLIDTINNNLAALRILDLEVEHWDPILVPIILEKLDFVTQREWQTKLDKEIPKFSLFIEFLEKRYEVLDATANIRNNSNQPFNKDNHKLFSNKQNHFTNKQKFTTNIVSSSCCFICKKAHNVFNCKEFTNKTITDRLKQVDSLKLCRNCLKSNHNVSNCHSPKSCKECHEKHHSLLHLVEFKPISEPSASTLLVSGANQILFSTVSLLILDKQGQFHNCRAVLDQCSEVSLITKNLCNKLNLRTQPSSTLITGVNLNESKANETCQVRISSRVGHFTTNLNCLVMQKITAATPSQTFDKRSIHIPLGIKLADPEFHISSNIDLLIGAGLYWQLIIGGPIQISEGQPFLQETHFGWLISGQFTGRQLSNLQTNFTCNIISNENLKEHVSKFFEIEGLGLPSHDAVLEDSQKSEIHFKGTTNRSPVGRFVIKLPFKDNKVQLGETEHLALKRYNAQEMRLQKNHKLSNAYNDFMVEYLRMGHMEAVPLKELENPNSFYLPHFPVFKQTPKGPKIRIVFDCSAKSSNNLSLNDVLLKGENLQGDLFNILCRFRCYRFAFSTDIIKMFRMIEINQSDTDYLRIFWRENKNESIKTYRLKTLTYGLTCAPFVAIRCLKQLALEAQSTCPLASQVIGRDMFMDDLISGSDTIDQALKIKEQVTNIFSSAGFELCNWSANDARILSAKSVNDSMEISKTEDVKVLGFLWNCEGDTLKYKVNLPTDNKKITKRFILSTVAKLFDPLGLINPVIVIAKIMLQQLWLMHLTWDQEVPKEVGENWRAYLLDLAKLNDFRISRNIISANRIKIELHGFADASTKAFGAVIYLKTISLCGNSEINLLCAKSRVAPIKSVTLPRLELNAAVLLSNLVAKIKVGINLKIDSTHLWTDSTIVLCWLSESAHNWSQFVANRVSQIQHETNISDWRHVKSCDNAADIISRGMTPSQLKNADLWWNGPKWLKLNQADWPVSWSKNKNEPLLERKAQTMTLNISEPELSVFSKISSFNKLARVIAYCLRAFKKPIVVQKILSVKEIERAKIVIFKYIQLREFSIEVQNIKNGKQLKSSKIAKLDPFIDSNGLLRVGGRLKNAPIHFNNKHPVLLPGRHPVTKSLIRKIHEENLHAGCEATLAAVRQNYWPIAGRNVVRKILYSCTKCIRANPRPLKQKMGNLPRERLLQVRPFLVSGVDFAGPYLIKSSRLRNSKKTKAYICLFVCFSTKAAHLELVGDLTTESFIAAFNRFTARRGHVERIFSDNGSNFVGAEREFFKTENFKNRVISHFVSKNTEFNFIPARSPHFGGLWERSIKNVKNHLRKVLGDASINYEEFYTLLTRVEACLNSRPLTPLSQDPNDLQALTPGHFLIHSPLTSTLERDLQDLPTNRLSRWQRVQQLQQHFWRRWQREYLSQLQTRPRGHQATRPNINIGALVLLVEENLPPLQWRLGRVVELHPGSDGVVRVVSVKTITGVFKRAITKICELLKE